MYDSYGDGWTGTVLAIGEETFTLPSGLDATACYTGSQDPDVIVTCDGGTWLSEVFWTIEGTDGPVLAGGAPFESYLEILCLKDYDLHF